LSFAVLLSTLVLAPACSRGKCEETCRRVAACKLARAVGERIPGEPAQPADATCMARCEADTPEFAACEGKKRECGALLDCIPYR
jgi:Cys-rich protein (TIGR04453 family)